MWWVLEGGGLVLVGMGRAAAWWRELRVGAPRAQPSMRLRWEGADAAPPPTRVCMSLPVALPPAVELLPEDQWRGPSNKLPSSQAAAEGGEEDADAAAEAAPEGAHIAQASRCNCRGSLPVCPRLQALHDTEQGARPAAVPLQLASPPLELMPGAAPRLRSQVDPGEHYGEDAAAAGAGSGKRPTGAACGGEGSAGEIAGCSGADQGLAAAALRFRACRPEPAAAAAGIMACPAGNVVGIIKRNWRTRGYCGSLQVQRADWAGWWPVPGVCAGMAGWRAAPARSRAACFL